MMRKNNPWVILCCKYKKQTELFLYILNLTNMIGYE